MNISISTPTPKTIDNSPAILQAEVNDLILFVVEEFGALVSGSIDSNWDKENNILYAFIDSGSFRGDNAKDIEMSINMNSDGSIINVYAKATLTPGDVRITANIVPADVNAYRTKVVKQAYDATSTLDLVSTFKSNDDIAKAIVELLGFDNVGNLSATWDDESSMVLINFDSADYSDKNAKEIAINFSVDENGTVDLYNVNMLLDDVNTIYSINDINGAEKFILEVGNYALDDLYQQQQATNHTSKLTNNISFDLYKESSDTNQSLIIDNGELRINETYSFDSIKLTDTNHYTQDINISDAIDVLRHIVDLETLTVGSSGYHAADVDNNGDINISDAIDILRHIVDLETIDTFDFIDEAGTRITNIESNTLDTTPEWLIVANGDVDFSGEFGDDYIVQLDVV